MEENITLKVEGMFCSNCELKIERKISKLNGVSSVKASFQKEEVNIKFDKNTITQKEIENNIKELDYKVIKNRKINIPMIGIVMIVLTLYLLLNHFNIFPMIETTMSYGMLFVVGILTSVHCIAMCGGINLSQSVKSEKYSNIYYNLGRVISYTAIGGIVGAIGSVITLNGVFRGTVAILAGIFMMIMGINMLGIFPFLRKFNISMPKKLAMFFNKTKKGKSSFYVGLLNGFMPCGPLQSMQLYALSTGSFFRGAISMFLFSLGTVPFMFGFGIMASKLNKKFAEKMLTISAIIIFVLGIGMLNNGLSLSGFEINMGITSYENMAEIVDDYQIIETTVDYGSYEPITVKKGIRVEWIVNVPEGKLNGCNGEMIIPEYNIDIKLQEGENKIEFMPDKTGTFTYSCWMGMIKSTITVKE